MSTDPRPTARGEGPAPARHYGYAPLPPDDEISLVDLLRALGRRWRWIAACALLALIAAAAFIAGRTPQYAYTATLRVGTLPTVAADAERIAFPIDTVDNVVGTLERHYIPRAARETGHAVGVSVEQVDDSDLLELSAEAPAARADAVHAVMQHALAQVVADHRQALAGRLNQLPSGTGEAAGEGGNASTREALQQAVEMLDAPVDDDVVAVHTRAERVLQGADPSLRPTRVLSAPERSGGPVGVSPPLIIALALILGLGAGVLLALLIDAVARETQRE